MINASKVKAPQLPREIHEFAPLGGQVVVRGITLSQRLELFAKLQGGSQFRIIPELLAVSVLDIGDQPVMTADQWDILGSTDAEEVTALYLKAKRLAGMEDAAEKK